MKLKAKIVSLYLITVFILLIIAIFVLSYVITNNINSEIAHRLQSIIELNTNSLSAYFSEIKTAIIDLAGSNSKKKQINDLISGGDQEGETIKSLDEFFSKYLKVIGCKDVYFIEPKDGRIIYSFEDKNNIGVSLPLGSADDNGLVKMWSNITFSEEVKFSDYTTIPSIKEKVLLVGSPILNARNQLLAVIVLRMDNKKIDSILNSISGLGEDGDLYLVGQDSLMRSQSRYKKENTILNENIKEESIRMFILTSIKYGKRDYMGAMKDKDYLQYKNYNGVKVMGNYGFIPDFNWALVAEISQKEASYALRDIMKVAMIVGTIFIVIVGIFALEVGGMITQPIAALKKGTELIMQGALDHKLSSKSDDEIGELSDAIDKMTTRLKNTYEGLEEKTKEFAKSLEQSERQNKMLEDTKITMMNILEDLEAERKKLQESEVKIRAVIENAIDGIIVLGSNGLIDSVNPAAEEIFDYPKDEIVGQNIKMLLPAQENIDDMEEDEGISKAEATDISSWETLGRREILGKRKDGSIFSMDLSVNEMLIGDRIMYAGIFRDITARKEAERRLVQQKMDLEKINLELDSFVYTASHDLRAPLRGIASFATFLEEDYSDKLDTEGKEYLEEIRKGADRLSALIDDLLALSRISRIKNPYEDVNINELINSIVQRIEFDIKDFNVDLNIEENIPTVHCDKIKIGEVFLNLINNAVKFSSKNNAQRSKVDVCYRDRPKQHEFYVKDNGIGIDPQYHDKIFGIFKRLHTSEEYGGTGAGLSIVKRIVEDHGGEVWVESRLGEGAEFHFTIPKGLYEKKKLGELLVEEGIITQEQLEKKLNEQRRMT